MKNKKIIKIIATLVLFCAAITYFVGSYFVNYALLRDAKGSERNVKDEFVVEDSLQEIVKKNREKQIEESKDFLEKIKAESVEINSKDGLKLRGHLAKNTGDIIFLIAHGYQTSEKESLKIAKILYEMGYSTLTIDMRAHGESEGKYIGMGYFEKFDLLNWIHFIDEKMPQKKIFLHGTSMGGASVLLAGTLELPKNVCGIVDDCGYTSAYKMFKEELKKRFSLPSFPVLNMATVMTRIKAKYNLKDTDIIKDIEKIHVPVLIIHGDKDDFVPVEMGKEIYEKLRGNKEIFLVKNADHADSKYVEPEKYYKKIKEFVEKYSN